ncbi:MAG: DUF1738 domain-containing protein [Prevotella sp.]|nr:DUF1738 domain-containing protein [Candidatus Prevotella equi]
MYKTNKKQKASRKNSNAAFDGVSAQEKALNLFAEMMIEKIESIQMDWKKPWFTDGLMQLPRNLSGRHYNGGNSLMLMLCCEKHGYKLPVFCTFDRVSGLNYTRTSNGMKQITDKEGNPLPKVSVNKGEKSFPVFLTVFTCVHATDGTKVSYEDYKQMTESQRKEYNVFSKLQIYNVFNIDQTNMKEARPEMYEKISMECQGAKPQHTEDGFRFEPVDRMVTENLWICPIKNVHGDDAYFSLSKNCIVFPEYSQFYNGEAYYSNLFHEMAHSTGHESQLNRIKEGGKWGDAAYGREELIAELTAALVAQNYGMDKYIKEDSAAYLKSWLKSLKEDPSYIKTVLLDVKRAASMLTLKIDALMEKPE